MRAWRGSVKLIILGGTFLLTSWFLLLLLAIRILTPSLLLAFLAYAGSVAGLVIGVFGVVRYASQAGHLETSSKIK